MGRLDDIVARNKKANRSGGGLIGVVRAELDDPTDSPADRRGKVIAMAIVGGAVGLIVALVMIVT